MEINRSSSQLLPQQLVLKEPLKLQKNTSLLARIQTLIHVTIPALGVFFYYVFITNSFFQENTAGILAERALVKGNSKLLFALNTLGIDFNAVTCVNKSSTKMTVWECALTSDDPLKMIDDLLACRADINQQNSLGSSALHRAIEQALFVVEQKQIELYMQAIEKLLKNDVSLNNQDHLGNTPAHVAVLKQNRDNRRTFNQIWDLLEQCNADFSIQNNDRKTANELLECPRTSQINGKGDWIDTLLNH